METRTELRRAIRARRKALGEAEREHLADCVARHLLASRPIIAARRIAGYLAVNGELDLEPFLLGAMARDKSVYLPVLSPLSDQRLWFMAWHAETRFAPNRFGIPEPVVHKRDLIRPIQLDVVLTPLVGFDDRGNRLGMGGGFYDRTFAFRRLRHHWHRPLLIGCAYGFQRVETLESEAWDVPLDGVVTEDGLTLFDRRHRR
jgi:5-formyltetrahydrofolate cyclo-ligase